MIIIIINYTNLNKLLYCNTRAYYATLKMNKGLYEQMWTVCKLCAVSGTQPVMHKHFASTKSKDVQMLWPRRVTFVEVCKHQSDSLQTLQRKGMQALQLNELDLWQACVQAKMCSPQQATQQNGGKNNWGEDICFNQKVLYSS